ncbi:hypothetical protein Tco_1016962 [Tanacetum coccineum]|uniref:Reverse transcriptase domain-containing protein n=1 Tax=Tanacetum coccineum TaxID=301880 RepID=A0ABQ5FSQ4_9ASTR
MCVTWTRAFSSTLVSSDTEKLQELTVTDPTPSSSTPSSSSPKPTLSMSQHILSLFMPRNKFHVLAQHLQEVMEESLPNMVDDRVKEVTKTQVPIYVAEGSILKRTKMQAEITNAISNHIPSHVDSSIRSYMSNHILHVHPTQASNTPCRPSVIHLRDQDDPQNDAHLEGDNSAKRQKTSEHGTNIFRESSYGQANESNPAEKVSQEVVEEMSEIVDEAKLRKVVDEMLRQQYTSGYENQDPKAPALSLVNQDLLYLKKDNSGPKKIVLSLHKFFAVIFLDDDIEERTSRWGSQKADFKLFLIQLGVAKGRFRASFDLGVAEVCGLEGVAIRLSLDIGDLFAASYRFIIALVELSNMVLRKVVICVNGNVIQANLNVIDIECFSEILIIGSAYKVKMDDPNITMEEYIRLEEEIARRHGKVTLSCESMVSPLNDNEIDFRISFDESDDEDYTIFFYKSSFSYKIIYVNDLKTDSENDNDKVNIPSFPSPEPTVSYFDDLDYLKDFEHEFPVIVYNDALTSKSYFLTEPSINPQRIDEFNLKDETS